MKNAHSIVTGVLAIAVIILFVLQFTGKKKGSSEGTYKTDSSLVNKGVVRIKYVMADSILTQWDFAKDLSKTFEADQIVREERIRNMEANFTAKQNKLKSDYPRLTNREIEDRTLELQNLQQQYAMDAQDLNDRAAMQQQEMNIRLNDTLKVFFPGFAKKVGADMILNNSSMIQTFFYADPAMDVTSQAIKDLNERYKKYKPKSTGEVDK